MKKILIIILWIIPCIAPAQGISFEHGEWATALEMSKKEGKLVFVDAFTTWCGPCKMLSRNTFPDSAVGAYFNKHFINVKMDMEKGEGIALAQQYTIASYPTLLFVNSTGELVHKAVGFHTPTQLIELGQNANNPEKQIGAMDKQYASGNRQPEFLSRYLEALAAAYDPQSGIVANKFLATQTDFSTERNMDIIARYSDDALAPAFKYLVTHRSAFDNKYGQEHIDARIQGIFDQHLMLNPELTWPETEKLVRSTFPEDGVKRAAQFKMTWNRNREDVPGYLNAATEYYQKYSSDNPDELNEVAWIFYKNTNDKKYLKNALKWAEKSVQLFQSYANTDTVAAIQAKLGKKKEAITNAKKAIELAKASGEDYSQTQLLLNELEKG
jgi:thiol-disulfide isomerase/thioredoxin